MVLKRDYKETEVGIIPNCWVVSKLNEFCEVVTKGTTPTSIGKGFVLTGINFIKIEAIDESGNINNDRFAFIDEPTHVLLKRSQLKSNDILFSIAGALGRSTLVDESILPANVNQALAIIRLKSKSGLDHQFLLHFLRSDVLRKHIKTIFVQAAQPNLSLQNVRDFLFVIPPLSEQRAIAAALSDVDALLAALDALIEKKRAIKQGVMQELLTGRRRLPGFNGDWKRRLWGDVIARCSSGATPYRGRPEYYKGDIKWIISGELNYNFITDTKEHITSTAVKETNLEFHPVGTFLMAITGLEAAGTRGACGIVGSPATTNQSCMAIYPTQQLLTEYLFYYYIYQGEKLAFEYCQGTKQQIAQVFFCKFFQNIPLVS